MMENLCKTLDGLRRCVKTTTELEFRADVMSHETVAGRSACARDQNDSVNAAYLLRWVAQDVHNMGHKSQFWNMNGLTNERSGCWGVIKDGPLTNGERLATIAEAVEVPQSSPKIN